MSGWSFWTLKAQNRNLKKGKGSEGQNFGRFASERGEGKHSFVIERPGMQIEERSLKNNSPWPGMRLELSCRTLDASGIVVRNAQSLFIFFFSLSLYLYNSIYIYIYNTYIYIYTLFSLDFRVLERGYFCALSLLIRDKLLLSLSLSPGWREPNN